MAYRILSYMTKPVTLSEDAYRVLRSLKRDGESFSDVVLRLAGRGRKDPRAVLRLKVDPAFGSWANYGRVLRKSRLAERRKMRRLYGGR